MKAVKRTKRKIIFLLVAVLVFVVGVVTLNNSNKSNTEIVTYSAKTEKMKGNILKPDKLVRILPRGEEEDKEDNYFDDIPTALRKAQNGDTLSLIKENDLNNKVEINKTITLDLNGCTIKNTSNSDYVLEVSSDLTITDTKEEESTGTITGANGIKVISGNLTIEKGNITATAEGGKAIALAKELEASEVNVNVKDGQIKAENKGFGIVDIDTNYGGTTINVEGGKIIAEKYSIFSPGYGGNLESNHKGGTTVITGGELHGNVYNNFRGNLTIGDNETPVNTNSPVIICESSVDGAVTNFGQFSFYDGILKSKKEHFSVRANIIPDNYMIKYTEEGDKKIATLVAAEASIIRTSDETQNETYYETIEEAIENLQDGDTIKILNNIEKNSKYYSKVDCSACVCIAPTNVNDNIILDMNGHSIKQTNEANDTYALVTACNLTIKNNGRSISSIRGCNGIDVRKGKLKIESDKSNGTGNISIRAEGIKNNDNICGIAIDIFDGSEADNEKLGLEINGTHIYGKRYGIYFGTCCEVSIDKSAIIESPYAIYDGLFMGGIHNCKFTLSECEIRGRIRACSGNNVDIFLGSNDGKIAETPLIMRYDNTCVFDITGKTKVHFYDGIICGRNATRLEDLFATTGISSFDFPEGYNAKFEKGTIFGTLTLEQKELEKHVTSINLNKSTINLKVGDQETLNATVTPNDADDKTVTWSSDTTSVATVDQTGKVTAVAKGTATITVTTVDGNKTATCAVTVAEEDLDVEYVPLDSIKLSSSSLSLKVGETNSIQLTLTPPDADIETVSWKSSKESVATVDNTGKITAVGEGTAIITVTVTDKSGNTKTATVSVTVTKASNNGGNGNGGVSNGGNNGGQNNGGSNSGGNDGSGKTIEDLFKGVGKDGSVAQKSIPKTGFTHILLIAAGIIASGGIFAYIRYKRILK